MVEFASSWQRTLELAVELGYALSDVKRELGHGRWLAWVETDFPLGDRMADNFMALSRNSQHVANLPPGTTVRAALDWLREQRRAQRGASRRAALEALPEVELPPQVHIQCADAAQLPLDDGAVDIIVTSPPYELGVAYDDYDDERGYGVYLQDVASWSRELWRIGTDQARLCLNVPLDITRGGIQPVYSDWLDALREAGWRYAATIIWDEDNTSKSVARGSVDSPSAPHVFARVETVLVMHKGEWNRHRIGPHDLEHDEWLAWTNGVWRFGGEHHALGHPAAFPEELPRRLLKLLSFRDDVVCDPFLGSGTTAVVAYRLARRFWGFDTSADYIRLARHRLHAEEAA